MWFFYVYVFLCICGFFRGDVHACVVVLAWWGKWVYGFVGDGGSCKSSGQCHVWRKEGNILFNDAMNTFYLCQTYGKIHSDGKRGNPLPSNMLLFPFAARVLLYAPSHTQDNTYHGLGYISHAALAGTRNSSVVPPWGIDPKTHRTMSGRSTTTELHLTPWSCACHLYTF